MIAKSFFDKDRRRLYKRPGDRRFGVGIKRGVELDDTQLADISCGRGLGLRLEASRVIEIMGMRQRHQLSRDDNRDAQPGHQRA